MVSISMPYLHSIVRKSYHHAILVNVPLQLSIAHEAGLVIVGGDDGFTQIFDHQTGAFHNKLDHGSGVSFFVCTRSSTLT